MLKASPGTTFGMDVRDGAGGMSILVSILARLLTTPAGAMARDVVRPTMLTLSPRPDWYVQGDKELAVMGWAGGTAGDVNGTALTTSSSPPLR